MPTRVRRGLFIAAALGVLAMQAMGATIALPASSLPPPVPGSPLAVSDSFLRDLQGGRAGLIGFDGALGAPVLPSSLETPLPVVSRVPLSMAAEAPAAPADPGPAAPASAADPAALLAQYRRIESAAPGTLPGLTAGQLREVWQAAFTHKIAGMDDWRKLAKYDPQGIIGFCFGRAMTVHLLARRMGLRADGVRKLFVIGDLRSGENPEWRFHVTTLLKGTDGAWHAVDPIMEGPLTVDGWIARVHQGWDRQKKAKFYLTGADAILPDITVVPDLPKEAGGKIIELAFDPEGRTGFTRWAGAKERVYEVDEDRQAQHLEIAGEENAPFDFLKVRVNGDTIGYNGYFVDLLAEIEKPSAAKPLDRMPLLGIQAARESLGLNVGKLRKP